MTPVRFVVRVLVASAMIGGVVFSILPIIPRGFSAVLGANETWVETAARPLRDGLTEELMHAAVHHGIIRLSANGQSIEILDEVAYETERLAGTLRTGLGAEDEKPPRLSAKAVLTILDRRLGAGPELRSILETAVVERSIVAVRDRGLSAACPITAEEAGCPPPVWALVPESPGTGPDALAPDASVRLYAGDPEPRVFGALARLPGRVNGPWSMTTGVNSGDNRLVMLPAGLEGTPAAGAEVVIDIIGRDIQLPAWAVADSSLTHFCLQQSQAGSGTRAVLCTDENSPADRIALRAILDGARILPGFGITARPVVIPVIGAALKSSVAAGGPESIVRVPLNDEVSIACLRGACWPELTPRPGERRLARDHSLGVEPQGRPDDTAEPPPADESGATARDPVGNNPYLLSAGPDRFALSDLAIELGMQPLLGIQSVASRSLIDFLVGLPPDVEAADFEVTFDANMQRSATDVLVGNLSPEASGPVRNALIAKNDADRRAALVLIDLSDGPARGAIRAAATYPPFDPDTSSWNLRALAFGSTADNPLAPPAWSGIDSRMQPGSTMKLLSALSLIHSAAGASSWVDPATAQAIAALLRGADPVAFRSLTGLDLLSTGTALSAMRPGSGGYLVRDRGSRPIDLAAQVRSGCDRKGDARLGLCEAIAASSNTFFASLALFENRTLLDAIELAPDTPHDAIALGRLFQHFGIEKAIPLVRVQTVGIDTRPPEVEAARLPSAPGIGSSPSEVASEPPKTIDIALNSFGQNVFVSPVVMASVAGAIGTGFWVDPYIARAKDAPDPVAIPVVPEGPLAEELLGILRSGMKGVMKPGGTGRSRFISAGGVAGELSERIWAKTGTATINDTERAYVHWFVGWVTDEAGVPRYAFACGVSHVAEDAGPCPRLTAEFLIRLVAEGRL